MSKIIYYVAVSLDGFIAGEGGDVSSFLHEGEGVVKYQQDLAKFATVIMGRSTYEVGYQYGLQPGQPAYPHMKHYIFSNTLVFEDAHPQVQVKPLQIEVVQELKQTSSTDIYLCGGGKFAGWLLENGEIDQLKLKLNPIVLGEGIPLFGTNSKGLLSPSCWQQISCQSFADGMTFLSYEKK